MKVADLKKGMILRITGHGDRCGFLTVDNPTPCGEPELRFGYTVLAPLMEVRGVPIVTSGDMIVYLGHDKLPHHNEENKTYLVRRVLVGKQTAVIYGHNFKYLVPHPDFK